MQENPKQTIEENLALLGIQELNPMQQAAREHFPRENSLVLLSPTGSGKTLAFLVPLIESLDPNIQNKVQALVMAPSRELVLQIEQVFKSLRTGYKINSCYGGHLMKTERQNLLHPPAVLVGTPGRMADHIRRSTFRTDGVQTLIIDEFDKALELGFEEDMRFIGSQFPKLRKRMLTSATQAIDLPDFIQMQDALYLNFLPDAPVSKLQLQKVPVEKSASDSLFRLLCTLGGGSTLVFCNFKEKVEETSDYLRRKGIPNCFFHGGLEQDERERNLVKFRNGSVQVLVCTDLAARGLDIPEIRQIVHLQLPPHEDSFIHRNGRTARMHAGGSAYFFSEEGKNGPDWLPADTPEFLPETDASLPPEPAFVTLYIGKGKKDKLRKLDIVGFLSQKGGLGKDDLGLIEMKDYFSYVAVKKDKVPALLKRTSGERIKNMQLKMEISR